MSFEFLFFTGFLILFFLRYHFPLIVTYKLCDPSARKPERAYHKAACYDVFAIEDVTIPVGGRKEIGTGVAFAPWPHIFIPFLNMTFTPLGNVAGKIYTRSGLERKKGLRARLGIMDNDYRESWTILMFNHNSYPVRIRAGDKIAQIEFYRVPTVWMVRVKRLDKSLRDKRGFGSSGK